MVQTLKNQEVQKLHSNVTLFSCTYLVPAVAEAMLFGLFVTVTLLTYLALTAHARPVLRSLEIQQAKLIHESVNHAGGVKFMLKQFSQ